MANRTNKTGELKGLSLAERLILAALDNIAHTLRPYPDGVKSEDLEGAINALRSRGLVQGVGNEPNLTRAGVEAAERLAARGNTATDDKTDAGAKAPEGNDDGDKSGDGVQS